MLTFYFCDNNNSYLRIRISILEFASMQILNEVNSVDHSHKGSFADRQKLTNPSTMPSIFKTWGNKRTSTLRAFEKIKFQQYRIKSFLL